MTAAIATAWLDDPEAMFILGQPNFSFVSFAQVWRTTGTDIPRKAEAEQAFFIRLQLQHLAEHGPDLWREKFVEECLRRTAIIKARAPEPPTPPEPIAQGKTGRVVIPGAQG